MLDRKSIRKKNYDYSRFAAYFVTVCSHERKCLFGFVANGEMKLNEIGSIVHNTWMDLTNHYPTVSLDAFVVMPNHIHGIVWLNEPVGAGLSPARTPAKTLHLSEVVGQFKSFSTRRANEICHTPGEPLWQRNYYDHIIRNERALNTIRLYIRTNPLMWQWDPENADHETATQEEVKQNLLKAGFAVEELDFVCGYLEYRRITGRG